MGKKYSRKNYLINREVQLKYLLLTIAMLVSYTLFLLAAIFVPQMRHFAAETSLAEKAIDAHSLLELHRGFWPAALAIITLFGVASVFMTHKSLGRERYLGGKIGNQQVTAPA